jgi:uncharacterized protein YjiS (DUF1127 family)
VQVEIDSGRLARSHQPDPTNGDYHGSRHQSERRATHVEQPGIFARLRQSFAAYREYLATCEELGALSDRQLVDMGASRLSIREIAHASVCGD